MGINFDPSPEDEEEAEHYYHNRLDHSITEKIKESDNINDCLTLAKMFKNECDLEWASLTVRSAAKSGKVVSIEQLERMEKEGTLEFGKTSELLNTMLSASENPDYNYRAQIRNIVEMGVKIDESVMDSLFSDEFILIKPEFLDSVLYFSTPPENSHNDPFFPESYEKKLENGDVEELKQNVFGRRPDALTSVLRNIDHFRNWDDTKRSHDNLEREYQNLSVLLNNGYDPNLKRNGLSLMSKAIIVDDAKSLEMCLMAGGKMGENERKVAQAFRDQSPLAMAYLEKIQLENSMSKNFQAATRKNKI